MAGAVSLKMIGEWDKKIGVPLRDALHVSMDVMGRTGEQACMHALILMAQSARAITAKAKPRREVKMDMRLPGKAGEYVEVWNQGGSSATRLHRWKFSDGAHPRDRIEGTWENARKIGNAGLAKRSWMWGLAKLKPMHTGKAIPGTSRVYTVTGETVNGYIKENRLGYILKAMPAGWEGDVGRAATNKIMAQARLKMENQWKSAMRRRERKAGVTIQQFFVKGLS